MPVHVVKQGDSLTSIADQHGYFWRTLWNHPKNAKLKEKRKNPNILMAGDQVFIPEKTQRAESVPTGKTHTFRVRGVPARLNLRLLDVWGSPRVGVKYTLKVDNQDFSGQSDDDGQISQVIPAQAGKAVLKLETGEEWKLDLGHVNPTEYTSGVQARLKNLGYYKGPISGDLDDATRDAIRRFQGSCGLQPTGEADASTQDALLQAHRS